MTWGSNTTEEEEVAASLDRVRSLLSEVKRLRRTPLPEQPEEAWVETMAKGVCKQQGWGQCAAICLSELHPDGQAGKCSRAKQVWGRQVNAAYAALRAAMMRRDGC